MKLAGVRVGLNDLYWVRCGDEPVSAGDQVLIETDEGQVLRGLAVVAPEQLIRLSEGPRGRLIEVVRGQPAPSGCHDLPGSELPALGAMTQAGALTGTVVQVDVLGGRVAVQTPEGDTQWAEVPD